MFTIFICIKHLLRRILASQHAKKIVAICLLLSVFSNAQSQKAKADRTPPTVVSINRQSPTTQSTNATSVTFRAIFSEAVTGVDATDFATTVVSGSLTSSISSVAIVGTDGTTYDVTVSSITGSGTLRLDLKATNTGIIDAAGNAITGGYTIRNLYNNKTVPTAVSINRQLPSAQNTNATSVTLRAIFSEAVTGVDATDFTATVVSGSLTSSISGV